MRHLRLLLPYLKHYRPALWAGLLWLLVTDLLGLLGPWLLKLGVDAVQAQRPQALYRIAALLATVALVHFLTRSWSRHRFLHAACRLENELRRDALGQLLVRSGPFFDRFRTGDLLSRFTSDIGNLRTLAGFGLMIGANTLIVYALTLAVLLRMSAALTVVALLPYPLLLLLGRFLSGRLLTASGRVQHGLGQVSEALEEGITGQAVIRSYGLQPLRSARFDGINRDYLEASLSLARLRSAIGPSVALLAPLATLLIFFFGGRQVVEGRLSLGELVAFHAYVAQLTMPTMMLGWILGLVQRGAASAERLAGLLAGQATRPALAVARPDRVPAVSLRDLSFAYDDEPVLQKVSLEVAPGSLVGVTGPTGCGKTTLLRLLAGLYPPPPGGVWIDGQDLTQLDGGAHRRRLTMVPQENHLFSGTLRDNLLYAQPQGGDALLNKVARTVHLEQDVAGFALGYDTRVGEGGLALSGGQRQRVCLGRALVRSGTLWLLDDPFSHLDAATAQAVWRRLQRDLEGKTVFLASGRASFLSGADRILVLDGGRPAAIGSHRELLAAGGLYARLVEKERLQQELEGLA